MNVREYDCPNCGEFLIVAESAEKVICSLCKVTLSVNRDADFVNGMWQDRTSLTVDNPAK